MILAILQARVSSSRLPGKVLKPLLGEPMLLRQIERVRRVQKIDQLLVATSTEPSDDLIEEMCARHGVACFRGNLNDVLDRFYQAAQPVHPDYVVRLTADCPLADPEVIGKTISVCLEGGYDYVSNALEPTFPDGLDVEVFRFSCLEQAWREARLPSQREHVTPFIYSQPERFKIGQYKNATDLSFLRWTVDEQRDFELVSAIYEELYPKNPAFATQDILKMLDSRPELKDLNTMHQRNEGYQKSLKADSQSITDQ